MLCLDGVVDVFVGAVVFGVQLAGFIRVMSGVGGVTGGDMGMVARRFDIARLMTRSGLAMMFGRLFVVVGGMFVVVLNGMG